MSISLYEMSVSSYLQTIGAVGGFLDKGLAFCTANKIDPNEIVESRLAADMLPLRFQITSVARHSRGAMEGVKNGVFAPPGKVEPLDYAGLQKLLADTATGLKRLTREEVD